jgi:hypothetical protein
MSSAPAATGPATETFDALARALRESGPTALLDLLVRQLDERRDARGLLEALLLKARHELGLPLVQVGNLAEIPDDLKAKYEQRYVDAIRTVGGKLLAGGDIPGAWPYFRAIGETEPVVRAIEAYEPGDDDERIGQVVEVAFNQGAHPKKGFELILRHYGICSAISSFEHLPRDETTRTTCAERLVGQLHEHLVSNLRAEIAHRGQPLPPEGTPIGDLITGRDWLFNDDAYHIDVSHLMSTVRVSPLLTDPAPIALAAELTDYGCRLSGRHRYEGDPPFEDVYADHRVYLNALLGRDVDAAIAHFRAKLASPPASPDTPNDTESDPDGPVRDDPVPAQVLVGLLARLGRLDEAIDVAAGHLAGLPESSLFCPGVSLLCQRAGQPDRLARIAREQGDLVHYAAAILQTGPGPS